MQLNKLVLQKAITSRPELPCYYALLLLLKTNYAEHTETLGSKQNLLSNSIKAKRLLRFVKLP